ncbi:MAG: hypothetical protein ACLR8P_01755 [Clostridium fessum]
MAKKLTEMEIFTSALYNALGVGHKNAQTRRELCKRLGCSDPDAPQGNRNSAAITRF